VYVQRTDRSFGKGKIPRWREKKTIVFSKEEEGG